MQLEAGRPAPSRFDERDQLFAVPAAEEVGGILWIRRHGPKAGKRRERRARPLPAVPDEILDAPDARAGGIATRRLGIPCREVERAVSRPSKRRAAVRRATGHGA